MNHELSAFLCEAKKKTYANQSAKKLNPSREGSVDYEYSHGQMLYHDTYFGGTRFMGEEVVYRNDQTPVWGMNYYGIMLEESLTNEVFNQVLRPALMRVGSDDMLPVRGPREWRIGNYRYEFQVNGQLELFEGEERIFKGDRVVYILKCHGGTIQK